jgi:hypothetical protein
MVAAEGEEREKTILDSPSVTVMQASALTVPPCLEGHVERSRGTTWGVASLIVTTDQMTNEEWW